MAAPYKMLLVGETGSGKTSFLNLLCNCETIKKLGFNKASKQLRKFNDSNLENARSREAESKTSGVKMYSIELDKVELKVGIMDTPGFGDTRGFQQDKINTKLIIDGLKAEQYINCVCLVINGRLSRITATLRYVLTEVTSILPREVLSNVIVVFTNAVDRWLLNLKPDSLQEYFGRKIDPEKIFCIENPYCRLERAWQHQGQQSADIRRLERSFDETGEVLTNMWTTIKSFPPVYTSRFTALYEKKQQIEREVLNLLAGHDYQRALEKKLAVTEEEVNAAVRTRQFNSNFRSTVTKPVRWTAVSTNRHNTLCGAQNCYSNCHKHCNLPKSFDKEVFKQCWCMSGDKCHQCGHSYIHHYHNEVLWQKEGGEETLVIDEATKKKYEEAKSMEERARICKQQLERDKNKSEQERRRLSEHLFRTIEEFQKLGVNRNYAKLLENQLDVIKQRLEGTVGEETKYLSKTKDELEKKLKLVQEAQKLST